MTTDRLSRKELQYVLARTERQLARALADNARLVFRNETLRAEIRGATTSPAREVIEQEVTTAMCERNVCQHHWDLVPADEQRQIAEHHICTKCGDQLPTSVAKPGRRTRVPKETSYDWFHG